MKWKDGADRIKFLYECNLNHIIYSGLSGNIILISV